ncbi:hypothetical protein [Desulfolutivibrio sp.]|uniref:hypothetical protein n=1 Tax=Desulfolutivibrio sp. TaxID=2773296 RepID=UPI002F961B0B
MKLSFAAASSLLKVGIAALCLGAFLLALPQTEARAMAKRPAKTPAMEHADTLMPETLKADVDRMTGEYREIKGRLQEADNRVIDVERRIAAETTQAGKEALSSLQADVKAEQARLIQEAEEKKIELDYLREVLRTKIKEYRD